MNSFSPLVVWRICRDMNGNFCFHLLQRFCMEIDSRPEANLMKPVFMLQNFAHHLQFVCLVVPNYSHLLTKNFNKQVSKMYTAEQCVLPLWFLFAWILNKPNHMKEDHFAMNHSNEWWWFCFFILFFSFLSGVVWIETSYHLEYSSKLLQRKEKKYFFSFTERVSLKTHHHRSE